MAKKLLPPNPEFLPPENRKIYYAELNRVLSESDALLEGTSLEDVTARPHSALQDIEGADDTDTDTVKDKHVSNAQMKTTADHIAATNAHGATGDIVGNEDYATTSEYGVVKKAETQTDATASTVSVTSTDAGATYTSAEQTLINELKADVNTLTTDLNAAIAVINALIDKLQAADLME